LFDRDSSSASTPARNLPPKPSGRLPAVRAAAALLAGLLALDCVLIVVYWLLRGELMASRSPAGGYPLEPLDFESPASLPSLLQYAQLLGAVALFIWAYRAERTRARLAAAAIVGLILLDDALELHEAFGRRVAADWDLPALLGLRPRDAGALIFAAALGAAILAAALWALRRASAADRRLLRRVLALVGLMAFFAIVVDSIHVLLPPKTTPTFFFATVEDGGELVVSTAMLAVALGQALAARETRSAPPARRSEREPREPVVR